MNVTYESHGIPLEVYQLDFRGFEVVADSRERARVRTFSL